MAVFHKKELLRAELLGLKKEGKSIGLVPTMGALHQGHLSLVKEAAAKNDVVVVSIFVNPTQFDNKDDLSKYPRDLNTDVQLLSPISPDIIVFAPTVEEMYTDNVSSASFDFDGLELPMEGRYRKGHFDGVGTIVKRLFEAVEPHHAYFGEKDYQQLLIIKTLVKKHRLPVQVHGCPIEREENGLAMSSRNERLTKEQREEAGFIYRTLQTAKEKFGTDSVTEIREWATEQFQKHPMFNLEYLEIADANTLKPADHKVKDKKYRAFIAVYADDVRLIDNIALN
ncbi:pantoate--beta-alanine ligase [Sinomicrobium weinanense]|uniref:Pantothenate synthetase n=1 Tax=Sinomicrobium weinanense TaxID=2842200 RepID=A0A926Q2D4_9FLAO|nr:pantoate--beta-alanine ligase [Sinomicrobium weinanense]MBC9794560.1 pantoate--beta-alanine ligase [Sinomicrobium weinanense]MBU3124045.1 pantoate--beta-alanine ligase [Sinomicrobium weinanense]